MGYKDECKCEIFMPSSKALDLVQHVHDTLKNSENGKLDGETKQQLLERLESFIVKCVNDRFR